MTSISYIANLGNEIKLNSFKNCLYWSFEYTKRVETRNWWNWRTLNKLWLTQTNNRRPTDHRYNLLAEGIKSELVETGLLILTLTSTWKRHIQESSWRRLNICCAENFALSCERKIERNGKSEYKLANDHWKYETATEDETNTIRKRSKLFLTW